MRPETPTTVITGAKACGPCPRARRAPWARGALGGPDGQGEHRPPRASDRGRRGPAADRRRRRRRRVSARTLRYYEELGLLTPSGNTTGGERRYRRSHLRQLERILDFGEVLGMTLDEIRGVLESDAPRHPARQVPRRRRARLAGPRPPGGEPARRPS